MKLVDAYGCDQCNAVNINGLNCHETGCPNNGSIKCQACREPVRRRDVYYANDWDGCEYCEDCAQKEVEFQEEEERLKREE